MEIEAVLNRARNPETTPEELRRLAKLRELRIQVAVKQNPAKPEDVKKRLAKKLGSLCSYEAFN